MLGMDCGPKISSFSSGSRTFCVWNDWQEIREKSQKRPFSTGRNFAGPVHFVQGRNRKKFRAVPTLIQTTVISEILQTASSTAHDEWPTSIQKYKDVHNTNKKLTHLE
jgi:hypothetical protein